jgi:hypothetical protein
MGIRINKAIGYGVAMYVPTPAFIEKHSESYRTTLGDFVKWCGKHNDEIEALLQTVPMLRLGIEDDLMVLRNTTRADMRARLKDNILYDDMAAENDREGGPLLLIPPGYPDWRRHDDPIDWVEATFRGDEGSADVYAPVNCGLFPYMKGRPPCIIAALCLWFDVPEVWPHLSEAVFTHWS